LEADRRMQSRKGVRSDFWPGVRNGREQSRLPCIGIADQADVGHDTEFQHKLSLLARLTRLGETRGLSGGGGKVAVAQASSPAFAKDKFLTIPSEVGDYFAFLTLMRRAFSFGIFQGRVDFDRPLAPGMADQRTPASSKRERLG